MAETRHAFQRGTDFSGPSGIPTCATTGCGQLFSAQVHRVTPAPATRDEATVRELDALTV